MGGDCEMASDIEDDSRESQDSNNNLVVECYLFFYFFGVDAADWVRRWTHQK
jgi:hypothetical protein